MADLRVALVHDWMANPGGGEKVVHALHRLWPDAPVFTAAYQRERYPELVDVDVRLIPLMRSRLASEHHQLFTLPRALSFRLLDLSDFDVVVSSSSAESKYVRTGGAVHVCYCHTPTRYYWSDYSWYLDHFPIHSLRWLARLGLGTLIGPLRRMDRRAAQRVDELVANSRNVQERIARFYGRTSTVVYPPVDVDRFQVERAPEDYFLVVGRLVAYKRVDLAIEAFNRLGLRLVVVGRGEELPLLQAQAAPNIEFRGRVSDTELVELLRGARALVFPGEEDFGIVPVEAMAAGVPVIAYGAGGALETVVDGVTGVHLREQTAEALVEAVRSFDDTRFDPAVVRARAAPFDSSRFAREMRTLVEAAHERNRRRR